jgi:hypothetical protein
MNKKKRTSDERLAPQRAAFAFLLNKFNTQELFNSREFNEATGWSEVSFRTYLSKQFRELLISVGDQYRVSLAFRQYSTWSKFRDGVVTQNRRLTREYARTCYSNVVMFEFFMPLRNEEYLRVALDTLFYKDSIKLRLRTISEIDLQGKFPPLFQEQSPAYLERVCEWIGQKFVGYSINHVTGRFRAGNLKTRDELEPGERYLVDETTAVVRFIFACDAGSRDVAPLYLLPADSLERVKQEADLIRWFFSELFVESILEVVNGEDEIWLLESGMQKQLHIYKVQD